MKIVKSIKNICLPRNIISLLLCFGLAVEMRSVWAVSATAGSLDHFQKGISYVSATFSDVQTSDWFYDNVRTVYEYGLMVGNSATTFSPNGNVTIAETVTLAARLHSVFYTGENYFEISTPWYQVYIDYAMANRIINAEFDDYNRAATRAEFTAILSAAFPDDALAEINQVPDNSIPDVKLSATYSEAVYRLYRAGILIGNDNKGTFAPDSNIQRREVAAIVSRMVEEDKRIIKSVDGISGDERSSGNGTPNESKTSDEIEPAIYKPSFVLGTGSAERGAKNVAVTVALKNNPGIASVGMTVSYDSALILRSIVYNEEIGGNYMLPPTMDNPAKLIWVSLADVEGDWTLATLYFDIKEDAALGYHQIAAVYDEDDVFDMTMSNVPFEVINGSINITE